MKECWDEGGLRAYLDRELPPEEMTRIAVHLGGCADCHARYNGLAGRAARVAALMETLVVGQVAAEVMAPSAPAAPRRWGAAVLALAAAAALAFILVPKHTEAPAPKPVVAPHIEPSGVSPQLALPAPPRAKSPKLAKRPKPPEVQYYLALDNEPIDTGVVMRVALDGTGVQADVIFDAEGRPRAIRTVK